MIVLELNDLDRRIWSEELDGFVPQRIFDAHTHIYRYSAYSGPDRDSGPLRQFVRPAWEHAGWDLLDECDRVLMPGRMVSRLAFPFPFATHCDFDGSNEFIAGELQGRGDSGALALVRPEMSADTVAELVARERFLGFKPYRFYSSTGDSVNCRITDFMPEHQLEVAQHYGSLVMMHLSLPQGIGATQNLDDLEQLTTAYPRVRWILAHCARSYSAWPIDRAGRRLQDLPQTWFDTSSVCESDAITALLRCVGAGRVMYGSDDVPVGILRGKYIAFGNAWAYLSESNHSLNLTHCDGRMTFTRYEQLRAMRQAAINVGLNDSEIADLFDGNARRLIDATRADLERSLASR